MTRFSTGNGFPDVVVTGVAMTTALATDVDTTWKKLLDGQSGIRKLDDPWVEQYNLPVQIGGHLLEDFDQELTRKKLHRLSYLQKMSTVLGRRGRGHPHGAGFTGWRHPPDAESVQPRPADRPERRCRATADRGTTTTPSATHLATAATTSR
jgi:hypothetical protein